VQFVYQKKEIMMLKTKLIIGSCLAVALLSGQSAWADAIKTVTTASCTAN